MRKNMFATRTNKNIRIANKAVEKLSEKLGCQFIDVNPGLSDEKGIYNKGYPYAYILKQSGNYLQRYAYLNLMGNRHSA